jgi:alpha-beta hydrolase superfamily lysophospholipase
VSVVTLHTEDGVALAARSWPAAGTPRGTVVLVHGFAASKDDPQVVHVAEVLASAGYAVLACDGRGHGASGGTCTLGDLERHDVAAVTEWASEHPGPVVLVGASMGAISVLRHAAAGHLGLAGVVTISSPAVWELPHSLRAILAALLTRTPPGRWLASRHLRVRVDPRWTNASPPTALAARIERPVAVIHGERDRMIPLDSGPKLAAACAGPSRLIMVPDMGHAFDPAATGAILAAVDWVVEAAG